MPQPQTKQRQICQLFAEQEDAPYCDQIGAIHVQGIDKKTKRRVTPVHKTIEIDPWTTTKEEIGAAYPQFDEFYIYAIDVETKRMLKGGHNFTVDRRNGGAEEEDEEETASESPPDFAQAVPPGYVPMMPGMMAQTDAAKQQSEMMNLMRTMVERQLESADKRATDTISIAAQIAGAQGGARGSSLETQALVDAMRSQIKALETQLDDARRSYRDDLNKRDREIEDMRMSYRDDVDRRRKENDLERQRYERDIDERRTRYERETSELRARLEKEITEGRAKYEREFTDMRQKLEKRIDELQRENFELRRELAETPVEGDDKPAASTEGMPAWAPLAAGVASSVMEWLNKQPAPQPAQPQLQPVMQPYAPQAYAPQAPVVAQPEYAPPPPPPPPESAVVVEAPPPPAPVPPAPVEPTLALGEMSTSIVGVDAYEEEQEQDDEAYEDDEPPLAVAQ